jgi:hypothetical protein
MSNAFQQPILATVYKVAAVLILIIGILSAIVPLFAGAQGLPFTGLTLVATLIVALPFFGIAQLFTYIGKTAFFAETISESLTLSMFEINKSLQQISRQLLTPAGPHTPQPKAADDRVVSCPHCAASLAIGKLHRGSNTCPECGRSFDVE